jgi:hypothetical protein
MSFSQAAIDIFLLKLAPKIKSLMCGASTAPPDCGQDGNEKNFQHLL